MAYKKSTAPEYYQLRSQPNSKNLTVTKFDQDLDATSSYHMIHYEASNGEYYDCSCPAAKFDCRHKGIMAEIKKAEKLDSPLFFCHQAPVSKPELQGKFLTAEEIG